MINPAIEEALETLYLHEVEQDGRVCDDGTRQAIAEAVRMGLVGAGDGRLTDEGRVLGRDVVRRHRLAERLLADVLGVSDLHAEEDACAFEHILQHGLSEKICALLGHPETCPHGKPIPRGPCCELARSDAIREVRPICDGQAGATGVVVYLATRENREVQKMMAMGILPGTPIQVIQTFPSYVFQIGFSQFAVDRHLAEAIYVHWK
jgi:DtxR family Mn-dependent transcriptional regulator